MHDVMRAGDWAFLFWTAKTTAKVSIYISGLPVFGTYFFSSV
jgi:hypothetical protein